MTVRTNMQSEQKIEVQTGDRFNFGDNWAGFLSTLDEEQIDAAEFSLKRMLRITSLAGKTFLDIGSGSGLFSLAARRLGASVHSFDYDPRSVWCTHKLKQRYFFGDGDWVVEEGSVLDRDYLTNLGKFDIVYAWGVLHHTGRMWESFKNICLCVAPTGKLFIAIYNNQGWVSRYWTLVKKTYNRKKFGRILMISLHAPYLLGLRYLSRVLTGRLSMERGMSIYWDMIDWLGGYPFETAKPEDIFHFFRKSGFVLEELKTCGGRMGCNEFVFQKK